MTTIVGIGLPVLEEMPKENTI